jgi:hypothetical protein
MANIRIDIASEFKDKGFKAAEKRTTSLTRKFDNLTRTARRTFIAVAGFRALQASVRAFAEEDKAANKLAVSLRNLGLAYNTKPIEEYLEVSEKATAISKDELSPAIAQLISTTLNAEKSMGLLNVAMDVSTATGKDLGAVTTALSRAYNGNFASLGKLQTAYTAAELEAMGFSKAVEALGAQFSGAAQQNAQTYSGKIDRLSIAFGDVKEEIGKGILAFLESLGSGDYDAGLQKLVNFGTAIGDVFRRAGLSIEYTRALLSTGLRIDEEEARRLEEIRNRFNNPQAAQNRQANNPASNRLFLADLRKQQALQKKIEADRKKAAALAAKAEKERLKKEKEAQMLKRAGTVFDMENIQIVAAMQGRVDAEQRLRLTALLAINTGNAEAAEKLSLAVLAANSAALQNLGIMMKSGDNISDVIKKIIDAQAKLSLVNLGIGTIPKAPNPFQDWPDIIAAILAQIGALANKISTIGAPGAKTSVTTTTTTTTSGGVGTGGTGGGGSGAGTGVFNPGGAGTGSTQVPGGIIIPDGTGGSVFIPTEMTNPNLYGAGKIPTGAVNPLANANLYGAGKIPSAALTDEERLALALGLVAGSNANAGTFVAQSMDNPNLFGAGKIPTASQGGVTVIVQGSVITEQDLTTIITDQIYQNQKAGQGITISSVAI